MIWWLAFWKKAISILAGNLNSDHSYLFTAVIILKINLFLFQVLSLHPDAAWLHIGCDEVYQLGQCPICSQKLLTANTDPNNSNGYQDGRSLFLQHVHRVASYVKNQKNVIPIIWDDMLRTIPAHILQVHTYLLNYFSGPNKHVHTPICSQKKSHQQTFFT